MEATKAARLSALIAQRDDLPVIFSASFFFLTTALRQGWARATTADAGACCQHGQCACPVVSKIWMPQTGKNGEEENSRARRRTVMLRTMSLLALAVVVAAGASWYFLSNVKTREAQLKRRGPRTDADDKVDLSFEDNYPFMFTKRGRNLVKRLQPKAKDDDATEVLEDQAREEEAGVLAGDRELQKVKSG